MNESIEKELSPMTTSTELDSFLSTLLQPERFKDFCPNGWQVEGKREVKKIVSGVTASLALIDAAIDAKADAIFVHHGLFWRGETRITGWMRKRLGRLIEQNINLFAYHLPLDAHSTLGNNAQLAKVVGLQPLLDMAFQPAKCGEQNMVWLGSTHAPTLGALSEQVKSALMRDVTVIGEPARVIKKVAWCTGGAQGYFEAAIAAGADVYITGEISEPQAHYAREMGVAYIACGHHASERYGAPAVAAHAAAHFGLQHEFIDIDNPA
jgi:dinuclear metal center YbgI/SA1388 family protein